MDERMKIGDLGFFITQLLPHNYGNYVPMLKVYNLIYALKMQLILFSWNHLVPWILIWNLDHVLLTRGSLVSMFGDARYV
jgi:hypothetical protein